jgi:hypothetical protein
MLHGRASEDRWFAGKLQRIDGSLVGIFTIAESIGTELLLQGMHAHVNHHTTRYRFYLKVSLRVGRGGRHAVEQHQYLTGATLRVHTQHLSVNELLRALQRSE